MYDYSLLDWEGDLWDDLSSLLLDIYLSGIDGGVKALPVNIRVLTDWDRINTKALEWAKQYRYTWVSKITETTRTQTQKAVSDWIASGAPLDTLERALEPIYGSVRAQMIAQTETTRVYAQANREAWESTDVVEEVVWQAANDELVCPVCGELNGTHLGIGDADSYPPAHVNCRCYILPVVSEDAVAAKLDEALS